MTDAERPRAPKGSKPTVGKRLFMGLALAIATLHRPVCTVAFGIAIGNTQGWIHWFIAFAGFVFIADGMLRSWMYSTREPSPTKSVVVETWTLEGKEAQQLHEQLMAATSKQRTEPLQ